MNIVIAMMCCHGQPCERNRDAFIEYVYKDYQELKKQGKLKHNYQFVFYTGRTKEENEKVQISNEIPEELSYGRLHDEKGELLTVSDVLDNPEKITSKDLFFLEVDTPDDIKFTYEKTVSAFNSIRTYLRPEFDYLVRVNISAFLNIRLLDKVIETADPEVVYCNAINAVITDPNYANTLYPRGDFYIISSQYIDEILFNYYKCSKLSNRMIHPYELYYIWDNIPPMMQREQIFGNTLDHVDDVLIGCTIKDIIGPKYFDKIKMVYYNLMIYPIKEDTDITEYLNRHVLSVRCKTVPEGQASGWSWNDNDYRKCDVIKFRKCYEYFSKQTYENGLTINHLLADENTARPVMRVDYHNVNPAEAKKNLRSRPIIGVK